MWLELLRPLRVILARVVSVDNSYEDSEDSQQGTMALLNQLDLPQLFDFSEAIYYTV